MIFLKLLQSFVETLHSEGTPGQVAAGIALGSVLGLTPLLNLHNALAFALIVVLNVSFGGAMLGWALFVTPLWTTFYNTPVMALTNFNNTVVLGSLVCWLVLGIPLFLVSRWGVAHYRATVAERVKRWRLYQLITASKLYNVYRLFRPER